MPPAAIASAVPTTRDSASAEPVRSWWRSRNSSTMAGGNLGAPPNPPWSRSYSPSSVVTAPASTSSVTAASGSGAVCARSRSAISPAAWRTCSPRVVQASTTAVSSWRNDGSAGCGRGG